MFNKDKSRREHINKLELENITVRLENEALRKEIEENKTRIYDLENEVEALWDERKN